VLVDDLTGERIVAPIFAGCCATFLGVGVARFGYAPLLPAMVQGGWLGPGAAGILGAANLAGYLLGALLAPGMSRKAGVAWPLRVAMAATTASLALCAHRGGLVWFLPWRVLAGAGAGVLMALAGPAVQAVLPARVRGLAAGLILGNVGLGSVAAALLEPAILPNGLAATWMSLAAVGALATALSWRFWPQPSRDVGKAGGSTGVLGPAVALLIVGYAFAGFAATPHMQWWPDYIARGLEQGVARGAQSWLVWSVCAACGPALFGWLVDRFGGLRILTAALLLQIGALLLPLLSTASPILALSVALAGATGTGVSALVLNRGRALAPEQAGRVWSLCTAGYAATQTLGGFSLAWVFAESGSHLMLFALGLFFAVLALVAVAPLRRARRVGTVRPTERKQTQ
jgi:predicted MFS family arabinose efflux permease